MDIDKEIDELQRQIDSLREKQKEKITIRCGQIFTDIRTYGYEILICQFNGKNWGYVYDDGSGMTFPSKEDLEHYLSDNKNRFTFYRDSCKFKLGDEYSV